MEPLPGSLGSLLASAMPLGHGLAAASEAQHFLSGPLAGAALPLLYNTAFIIKSFRAPDHVEVTDAIISACAKIDIKAKTAEEHVGSDPVIGDILREIRQSHFIICDLTDERPNVYYELGYADGVGNVGKNILLVARKDTNSHFDISHRRIRFYAHLEELQQIIIKDVPVMRSLLQPLLNPEAIIFPGGLGGLE